MEHRCSRVVQNSDMATTITENRKFDQKIKKNLENPVQGAVAAKLWVNDAFMNPCSIWLMIPTKINMAATITYSKIRAPHNGCQRSAAGAVLNN
jgi:hypothetical protein